MIIMHMFMLHHLCSNFSWLFKSNFFWQIGL